MRRITRGAMAVLALGLGLALLAAGGPASAKKPPKPPPDPVDGGILYFRHVGLSDGLLTMEPDGSDTTEVGVGGVPSLALHGGERWFLQVLPHGTYPDGRTRHEIFAVTAGGQSVQLTDDATVEPQILLGDTTDVVPKWAVHASSADGKVSYLARRRNTDGTYEDVGLYVVTVDLDDLPSHQPGLPSYVPLPTYVLTDGATGPYVDMDHAWSPDGARVAYLRATGPNAWDGLWRANADGSGLVRVTTQTVRDPDWKPDGTEILGRLAQSGAIATIALDGTTTVIVEDPADRRRTTKRLKAAFWSPAGSHIVYTEQSTTYGRNGQIVEKVNEIHRATASGSGETSLGYGTVVAWREDG